MKNLILAPAVLFFICQVVLADIPGKIFSKNDIKKLAGAYIDNKPGFDNPLFVDVDKDGDFDALLLNEGSVEYYKNTGTLENPVFVMENKNYDKYDIAFFSQPKIPYPVFFADNDGDNDLDMFVIKDKTFDNSTQRYEYRVTSGTNFLNLDTGTLITIILVLVIILLVLAIL